MERIEIAKGCAYNAAETIRRMLNQTTDLETEIKEDQTIVTRLDKASKEVIYALLNKYCPDDAVLSEEFPERAEHAVKQSSYWSIDELDGTVWCANGIFSESSVSVGYVENGVPVLGAICFLSKGFPRKRLPMVAAERGRGCFVDDKPCVINFTKPLRRAVVGIDMNKKYTYPESFQKFIYPLQQSSEHTRTSSATFSILELLQGKTGLYFANGIKNWDIAAGAVAVEEAGGFFCHADGSPLEWNRIEFGNVFFFSNASIAAEAFAALEKR
ncbi:MAG: inositol monophosphatase family protein [Candidatus Sungbacteria bacterium]|nr:inositol monophosphatase family protein [Candidatus Sungbacteria bacterium]